MANTPDDVHLAAIGLDSSLKMTASWVNTKQDIARDHDYLRENSDLQKSFDSFERVFQKAFGLKRIYDKAPRRASTKLAIKMRSAQKKIELEHQRVDSLFKNLVDSK